MRSFPHGITRSFLTACGGSLSACLPWLLLDGSAQDEDDGSLPPQRGEAEISLLPAPINGQDQTAENCDLQHEDEGDLLPTSGVEAETVDLLPSMKGQINEDDDMGCYPPGEKEEGSKENLPPSQRGHTTENLDLPPMNLGHQNNNLLLQTKEDGDGTLQPSIGVPSYNGEFFPSPCDYPQFDVMHDWKHYLFAYMHTQIGRLGMVFGLHDDFVIVYAKPRVDPKVKKKMSLLLCLTINSPFHPGEYGHDGSPRHHYHEPYSSSLSITLSIIMETSSSSIVSIHVSLFNATHYGMKQPPTMPFTPLRGREGYQAHERQLKMMPPGFGLKMKMKRKMIEMELLYINKDLLDPG